MISFNAHDAWVAEEACDVMLDFCESNRDYTRADHESVGKLRKLQSGLLVTGAEQSRTEAEALLKEVVLAELDNWVADSSQRLINRAATVLVSGGPVLDPILEADHGRNVNDHALVRDWVCGIHVLRCCTCARLFKV